uniref:Uncharacterized protein n=1 Tax=Rhizophora mucronata TaxID=61149 RepID=A0A2P2NAG3_RHIMU
MLSNVVTFSVAAHMARSTYLLTSSCQVTNPPHFQCLCGIQV